MQPKIGKRVLHLFDELVDHFKKNQEPFKLALKSILDYVETSEKLKELVHSVKYRLKDPDHLKDKLQRKYLDAMENKKEFDINKENLFVKINDLAGFRVIHLHTKQFEQINEELKRFFADQRWVVVKKPSARTWDDESREYFRSIGIGVDASPNMYTSVHYIIKPNTRSNITCEIQVRTLMEEVWGEVDHTINYPHKSESISCREQIKTLARATSAASRLVDSIFTTHNDFNSKIIERINAPRNVKKTTTRVVAKRSKKK